MIKRRAFIFSITLIITSIIIGFVIGKVTINNSNKNIVTNPFSMYSNSSKNEDCDRIPSINNNCPFELYNSFLVNSSDEIINALNNNPIDKIYCNKYSNAKSPIEEQDILSEWISAYENEFKKAKSTFKNLVKEMPDTDSNISKAELISIMNVYTDNCLNYNDSTAQLAYYFEEFLLGHGTNHVYDLLYNQLELNRTNTLKLIECIYFLNEEYNWL